MIEFISFMGCIIACAIFGIAAFYCYYRGVKTASTE